MLRLPIDDDFKIVRRANLPIYKNPTISAANRVKDLLSRMTLEEKSAQMMCAWQKKSETFVDADGNFASRKAKAAFKKGYGLGQVGRPSDAGKGKNAREMAELTNAIQTFFLQNSRLGIPVMFHAECLRGHAAIDGTSFPQPIGLAGDAQSRIRRIALRHGRRRGPCPRHAPSPHPRSWMWRANHAGAALRKPSAKIRIWSPSSAWPPFATFGGVTDGDSWLNNWPVIGRTAYPLLFNREVSLNRRLMPLSKQPSRTMPLKKTVESFPGR